MLSKQILINGKNVFENGKLNGGLLSFILYDTYGFPFDLTQQILREKGIEIDEKDFEKYLKEQQDRSKNDRQKNDNLGAKCDEVWKVLKEKLGNFETEKLYYQNQTNCHSKIIAIIKNNKIANELKDNEEGYLVLDKTTFYPCGGGEVGDKGVINKSIVRDTKKFKGDLIGHDVFAREELKIGDEVECYSFRKNVCKNHTATHLLQSALREVLGNSVQQKGSFVSEEELRFDFSSIKAMTTEEIKKVEEIVNNWITSYLPVKSIEMQKKEAEKLGALHFFEDKYGENVRVVMVGFEGNKVSTEFCGGIHCKNTGEIEQFVIIKEASIGSGVRRITAITGQEKCINFIKKQQQEQEYKQLKEEFTKYQNANEGYKRYENYCKLENSIIEKEGIIYLKGENINIEVAKMISRKIMTVKSKPVFCEIKTTQGDKKGEVFCYNCCQKNDNYNCKEVIDKIIKEKGGKGGGTQNFAQIIYKN